MQHPVETQHAASLQAMQTMQPMPKPGSISAIVRSYKSAVTHWAGQNDHKEFAWQERFYDHIICNEISLENIRTYILANPGRWDTDEYYA
jgi:REP-associated tyrosine transposase